MRKLFYWKLKKREIKLGERTVLMGVLNVTPDSFSDGGRYSDPDRAFARALELEEQGADILDIGAESTRPARSASRLAEEMRRLDPGSQAAEGPAEPSRFRWTPTKPKWPSARWNWARRSSTTPPV